MRFSEIPGYQVESGRGRGQVAFISVIQVVHVGVISSAPLSRTSLHFCNPEMEKLVVLEKLGFLDTSTIGSDPSAAASPQVGMSVSAEDLAAESSSASRKLR